MSRSLVIGFTGTQRGLNLRQIHMLQSILADPRIQEFHHGDCIGADRDAHMIARAASPEIRIVSSSIRRSIRRSEPG